MDITGDELTMEDMEDMEDMDDMDDMDDSDDFLNSPEFQKLMDLAAKPHTKRQKEAYDVYCRLERAVELDDCDEFACLIRSSALRHLPPPWEVSDIGKAILRDGHVKCAEMLLFDLPAGIFLDHNFGLSPDGWSALHYACIQPYVPMIEKLLDSGCFDPDLRADMPEGFEFHLLKQALPLNVGLRAFRIDISNIPERSAFSLLHYFYTKMNDELDAIRLLAVKTTEFKEEFLNYAKQGKLVELTALLLAAGDNLLPLLISEGGKEHKFNSFKELHDFLQKNKNRWSSTMSNDDEFAEWKETLTLLDIYDKVGNQLTAYAGLKKCRRSGMEVQDLLKAQCFDVESAENNLHNNAHVESSNKLKALHSGMENSGMKESGMESSGMKESGMEKAQDFDARINSSHKPYHVPLDRSNNESFKSRSLLENGEFENIVPKEDNMLPFMSHMPRQPPRPTVPLCDRRKYSTSAANQPKQSSVPMAAKGFHGGSILSKKWLSKGFNYSTSAANNSRPMKWLNAIQNHNSNNSWLPFLRILSKRVR